MQNLEEYKTESLSTDASGPVFVVRATIKALEILSRLLVTAIEIRDVLKECQNMQSCHGHFLVPNEAKSILKISRTKLQELKDNGALINGVHYWQDGSTVRYFPDFATKLVKAVNEGHKELLTTDKNDPQNSQSGIDETY